MIINEMRSQCRQVNKTLAAVLFKQYTKTKHKIPGAPTYKNQSVNVCMQAEKQIKTIK